jgi:hypothetical protein
MPRRPRPPARTCGIASSSPEYCPSAQPSPEPGPSSISRPNHSPRRTRSGKRFEACGQPSRPCDCFSFSTSCCIARETYFHLHSAVPASRQARDAPVAPGTSGKRKRGAMVVPDSSDASGETPPRQRRRRGPGPKNLTDLAGRNEQEAAGQGFIFEGVPGTRLPSRTINFPWGFSIPLTEHGHPDRQHSSFAQIPEASMRSVLTRIGCSVVGKNKNQLVQMCIAYAAISMYRLPNVFSLPFTDPYIYIHTTITLMRQLKIISQLRFLQGIHQAHASWLLRQSAKLLRRPRASNLPRPTVWTVE